MPNDPSDTAANLIIEGLRDIRQDIRGMRDDMSGLRAEVASISKSAATHEDLEKATGHLRTNLNLILTEQGGRIGKLEHHVLHPDPGVGLVARHFHEDEQTAKATAAATDPETPLIRLTKGRILTAVAAILTTLAGYLGWRLKPAPHPDTPTPTPAHTRIPEQPSPTGSK